MKHSDIQILKKMIRECEESIEFSTSVGEEIFLSNSLYQKAVAMSLINVGEYANALSREIWTDISDIEWRKIVDLRNFVAHGYGEVDMELIWSFCQKNVPMLLAKLRAILSS